MKGETIWIDAELAERLDGLWKDWQEQETDKRRFRQRKEELDSIALLWHYIDTASHRKQIAGREGEDWVPVANQVGAKIGKKDRSKFKEIKETLDQWGVAELDSQGHHKTHHMMVNHSDKGLVESAGGHLVRIDSLKEFEFIMRMTGGAGMIDGTTEVGDGKWRFANGEELKLGNIRFRAGEPNNSNTSTEFILVLTPQGINDQPYNRYRFIIEWD